MMKKWKQLLVAALAISMISLAGCGAKNSPAESSTGASSPSEGSSVPSDEGETSSESSTGSDASETDGTSSAISDASKPSGSTNGSANGSTTTTSGSGNIGGNAVVNPGNVDFGGKTITLRGWWGFQHTQGSDTTSKKQAEVLAKIEKEFNCKIAVKSHEQLPDERLKASILAGKPDASLLATVGAGTLYDYYSTGCLMPMDSLRYFDYKNSDKYVQTDIGKINGKTYAVVPKGYGWLRRNYTNILMANFTLTAQAGYSADQIYKWVNNGEWTWDKFEEVGKKVAALGNGRYGLSDIDQTKGARFNFDTSYLFYASMLWSNNTDWIKTSNGTPSFNGNDAKAQAVLTKYTEWANTNTGFIKFKTNTDDDFRAGKAAFYATIYPMPIIADWICGDANNKVGVIPFPKGPDAKDYVNYQYESIFIVIPKGVSDVTKIGAVLDAFCSPLYSDAESRLSAKTDIQKTARVKNSIDEMMRLYDNVAAAQPAQSMYGIAANLGVTGKENNMGWYDYVGKVASGGMTAKAAIDTFTNRCNNILKKTFS